MKKKPTRGKPFEKGPFVGASLNQRKAPAREEPGLVVGGLDLKTFPVSTAIMWRVRSNCVPHRSLALAHRFLAS